MLPESRAQVEALPEDAVVLDVGGWASPLSRADWVIDLMPHATRGLYGHDPRPERFTQATWVQHDICAREAWPFADGQFDFVVCSHTLEDVRDPIWVCQEMARVAKAGYVEVPSRREEQAWGVEGPWVGWGHHHWLIDVDQGAGHIEFVFKHHILHAPEHHLAGAKGLTPRERVQTLWWEGAFTARERIFFDIAEFHAWLADVPPPPQGAAPERRGLLRRARR
jgi:SAM-dependent methyltransferase